MIAKVDATKLPFRKEDGRNLDNLTLVVGLFDQNGNFISATQKDIQTALKDATLDAWMKSGIDTTTDFKVSPGKISRPSCRERFRRILTIRNKAQE